MTLRTTSQRAVSGLSYLVGGLLAVAILLMFVGLDTWSLQLSRLPFMKIHPRYAGGAIAETIEEGSQRWAIHEPVFDGLFGPRKQGFVQVDLTCSGEIPDVVEKTIDYNRDGDPDFLLRIRNIDKLAPEVVSYSDQVETLNQWARTEHGWIVRIGIRNK